MSAASPFASKLTGIGSAFPATRVTNDELSRTIETNDEWIRERTGFVYALTIAAQFIRTGQAKTSLVVGAEVLSPFVNWKDRASCIIFGDGAGAVVVERAPRESASRILSTHLHSDGALWDLFYIEA